MASPKITFEELVRGCMKVTCYYDGEKWMCPHPKKVLDCQILEQQYYWGEMLDKRDFYVYKTAHLE